MATNDSVLSGSGRRRTAGDLKARLRPADPINSALRHGASLQQRSYALGDGELFGPGSAAGVSAYSSSAAGDSIAGGPIGGENPFAAAAAAGLGGSGGNGVESGSAALIGSSLGIAAQLEAASGCVPTPSAQNGRGSSGVHRTLEDEPPRFRPRNLFAGGGVARGGIARGGIASGGIASRGMAGITTAAAAAAEQRRAIVAAAGTRLGEQQHSTAASNLAGSSAAMDANQAQASAFEIGASGRSRKHMGRWKPADSKAAAGAAASTDHRAAASLSSSHGDSAADFDSDGESDGDAQQILEAGPRRRSRPSGARWKPRSPKDSPERAASSGGAFSHAAGAAGNGRLLSSSSAGGSTRGSSSSSDGSDAGSLHQGGKWRPHDQPQQPGKLLAGQAASTAHSIADGAAEAVAIRQGVPAGRAIGCSSPKRVLRHGAGSVLLDGLVASSSASGRPASRDTQSHVESWLHGIGSPESRGRQPSSGGASSGAAGGALAAAAAAASPGANQSEAFGSSMEELSALAVTAAAGSPLVHGALRQSGSSREELSALAGTAAADSPLVAGMLRQSTPGEVAAHRIDIDDSEARAGLAAE